MSSSIEFLMVVTNRGVLIADYAIRSFKKVDHKLHGNYEVVLKVCLNCINYEKYQKYIDRWSRFHFVELVHDSVDFDHINGEYIVKKTGLRCLYPMLPYPLLVDKYFSLSKKDYFATVDDDFEVLNPDFLKKMLQVLEQEKNLAVISTDRTTTHILYDSYSNDNIEIQERNDTWCCIYKTTSFIDVSSMLIDQFIDSNGCIVRYNFDTTIPYWDDYVSSCHKNVAVRQVWDGGAYLQMKIREKFTHPIICVNDFGQKYKNMYIHYAAFGKNSSVNTPLKTYIYRMLYVRKEIGFICLPVIFNKKIRVIYRALFNFLFKNAIDERSKHLSNSNMD